MVHFAAYDYLMIVARPKAFPSTNFKQQAVMTISPWAQMENTFIHRDFVDPTFLMYFVVLNPIFYVSTQNSYSFGR